MGPLEQPSTVEQQPEPPPPAESRTCRKCSSTKVVTPETWPYRKGRTGTYQAYGGICLVCEKQRKADYEARRDKIAALFVKPAGAAPVAPTKGKADDKRAQLAAESKLDVARALKAGSHVLNEIAPNVLARILMWSEDETHEQHAWAVEFLAQRILPRKLYEELGGTAAGAGALADKRPQYVIQILPARPGAPEGRVIEGQAQVIDVTPERSE